MAPRDSEDDDDSDIERAMKKATAEAAASRALGGPRSRLRRFSTAGAKAKSAAVPSVAVGLEGQKRQPQASFLKDFGP